METEKEKQLWRIAKKRVDFKRHFATYIIINAMFWCLWFFTTGGKSFPWPVWPMAGWGIGILFSYLNAYVFTKEDAVEKEFEKLKAKNN